MTASNKVTELGAAYNTHGVFHMLGIPLALRNLPGKESEDGFEDGSFSD